MGLLALGTAYEWDEAKKVGQPTLEEARLPSKR